MRAAAHFGRVLALEPGHLRAHDRRGFCLYRLGRWDEALEHLDRALAIDPHDTDALGHRAVLLRDLGRHEDALTDFGNALLRDTCSVWFSLNRAETYRRLGRLDAGLADADRTIGRFDAYEDSWAHAVRARIHRQMGHYDEALADHLYVSYPGVGSWEHHEYGVTLARLGRADEAREQWGEAVRHASAWAVRGRSFEMEERAQLVVTLCASGRRVPAVNRTADFLTASPTRHQVRALLTDLDALAAELPVGPGILAAVRDRLRPAASPDA